MYRILAITEESSEYVICRAKTLSALHTSLVSGSGARAADRVENRHGIDCLVLEWPLHDDKTGHNDIWIDCDPHNVECAYNLGQITKTEYRLLSNLAA